ncbi:MAG: helix-turn-helix domain-containing protein [Myxococcales bacterium]|nr:helix-turn-helix domain-containing protein [Myxococcales bacterium]
MPRPSVITPKSIEDLTHALSLGGTRALACQYAGISLSTFYEHLRAGESEDATEEQAQFSDAVRSASAKGDIHALGVIRNAMRGDPEKGIQPLWTAAAWMLERRHPGSYGRSRIEHTGADGGPLTVALIDAMKHGLAQAERFEASDDLPSGSLDD